MNFRDVFPVIAVVVMLWCLGAACASVQAQDPEYARFVSVSDAVDGRVHVLMQWTTADDGTFLRIREVEATPSSVDIWLEIEVLEGFFGPEVQVRRQPLTIDQLPPGTYPLRILNVDDPATVIDQVTLEVPEQIGFRHPLPARVWPPEPGLLDDIWLLLAPPGLCDRIEPQSFFASAERVVLLRTPETCPLDGSEPRLSAIRLGASTVEDSLKQWWDTPGFSRLIRGISRISLINRQKQRLERTCTFESVTEQNFVRWERFG